MDKEDPKILNFPKGDHRVYYFRPLLGSGITSDLKPKEKEEILTWSTGNWDDCCCSGTSNHHGHRETSVFRSNSYLPLVRSFLSLVYEEVHSIHYYVTEFGHGLSCKRVSDHTPSSVWYDLEHPWFIYSFSGDRSTLSNTLTSSLFVYVLIDTINLSHSSHDTVHTFPTFWLLSCLLLLKLRRNP